MVTIFQVFPMPKIKIYKFGGGILHDASSVRKLCNIVQTERPGIVVISAFGKTTRALEAIFQQRVASENYDKAVEALIVFHQKIMEELFPGEEEQTQALLTELRNELVNALESVVTLPSLDTQYNAVVSWGELIAVQIVQRYVHKKLFLEAESGFFCRWVDARRNIKTKDATRNAQIDWTATKQIITIFEPFVRANQCLFIQGFVGSSTVPSFTTTLGKEGSDYTAAIIASLVKAATVTIWKDVPGIMNADPKVFKEVVPFDTISYHDLAEMASYGAKVIHPKTLQPLANSRIPLYVKSFHDPQAPGTVVTHEAPSPQTPIYVLKKDMCLVQLSLKGFQFFEEKHLKTAFSQLNKHGIQTDLLAKEAYKLTLCLSQDICAIEDVLADLDKKFKVHYQAPVSLLTVIHPPAEIPAEFLQGATVLLTQQMQRTYQVVFQTTTQQ